MATQATLAKGVKSLHLSFDTPVDVFTGKVRKDLSSVRVWYSTQANFNPVNSEGTQAFNGLSLDVTITDLEPNTQYYVKYAFISAIDPTTFTISDTLTEVTYDENTTIYGNLTNPSSFIPTDANGENGSYINAKGVFRVYKYSQEVTGSGVVYAEVAGSNVGGLTYVLDDTAGEYTVIGQTDDYASVILSATYEGVTIQATLVCIRVRQGRDGTSAQQLVISSEGNAFVFPDAEAAQSDTLSINIKATLQNLTGSLTWLVEVYNKDSLKIGNGTFTQTSDTTITISREQFNAPEFNNTVAFIVVTVNRGALVSDSLTIYRVNNGSEQILIEFSNDTDIIPAYYDETVVESGYEGSGTEIRVREGNKYLTVDNTIPFTPGTWTVTSVTGVGIAANQNPQLFANFIKFGNHSNMTFIRAHIDYGIEGVSSTGKPFAFTRRQSFTKSIAGAPGYTASLVSLTSDFLVFIKYKDGTHSGSVINLFATPQNIPDPTYVWSVNGVVQSGVTLDTFQFQRPQDVGVYNISVTASSSSNPEVVPSTDNMSIAYIEEGSDALTFLFKDPNVLLSANNLGIVENGITSVVNHIIAARGMYLLTPPGEIVYSIHETVNCTAVLGSVVGTWNQQFTISGQIFSENTISNASVTIKAVPAGGEPFYQTCYIAKVKKGDSGADALTVDLLSESDVIFAQSDGTGYTLPPANSIKLYKGGSVVSAGVTYGVVTATRSGLTVTVDSATGAFSLSGTNWTSNTENFTLTATYNGITYNAVYSISKSRAGSDAVFVDLLSEADVITANADGTGYTLPTGNSLRIFKGGVQVTSGVVYSGGTTKNGLTLAIDANTGAITLSGASWTSNQETFTLTATYLGTAYTYRYKIAKARAGSTGATGSVGPVAPKVVTGYVYYQSSTDYNPGTPSASSYTFSNNTFTGLSSGWSLTIPATTGNNRYWAASFSVTESSGGSNVGTPVFSGAFNHINLSGLVTFTNLANSGQTYINGGNIGTSTLSVDTIRSGTYASANSTTFGFGAGNTYFGINAVGSFNSNNSSYGGVGVFSMYTDAMFVTSGKSDGAAALFSNTNGYGTISNAWVTTAASICNNSFGAFIQRRTGPSASYPASATGPTYLTGAYGFVAYLSGATHCGGKFVVTDATYGGSGNTDRYGAIIGDGSSNRSITTIGGPVGPFTGAHDAYLPNTSTIELGDIVVDVAVIAVADLSDTITTVEPSSRPLQKGVVGVFIGVNAEGAYPHIMGTTILEMTPGVGTEEPVQTSRRELDPKFEQITSTHQYIQINALGEGMINVCGEGGDLEIGDLIATSSVPGKGMKQPDDIIRAYTVAKVRENVTFASPSEVKQVACIYLCG